MREVRRILLDSSLNPIVLRQCCPPGDLLEKVASMKVPGLSGKYNLPPGSGPLKDGTPERIVELRKARPVSCPVDMAVREGSQYWLGCVAS